MKKLPFAIQLTLILFLILVIPCAILTYYSNYSIYQYSQAELASVSVQNLQSGRQVTESILGNISSGVQRWVSTVDFNSYGSLKEYSSIQENVENGIRAQKIERELLSIAKTNPGIQSVFLILNDSDFVISTDRGVVPKESYPSLTWLQGLSGQNRQPAGIWVPRVMSQTTLAEERLGRSSGLRSNVISYVYSLNKLTTAVNATIVVNLKESYIAQKLNPTGAESTGYGTYLLDGQKQIISDPEDEAFLTSAEALASFPNLLNPSNLSGYAIQKKDGRDTLYTYLKTDYFDWSYLSIQSLDSLSGQTAEVSRNTQILMALLLLFGLAAALAIVQWLSKPMRSLVKNLRQESDMLGVNDKNEMAFLQAAFQKIRQNENQLAELLGRREKDARKLALRNILTSEHLEDQDAQLLKQSFPHAFFLVVVIALDRYADYRKKTNSELREYHRYLFFSFIEELFSGSGQIGTSRLADSYMAVVINWPDISEHQPVLTYEGLFLEMQKRAEDIFGTTVTIGVGQPRMGLSGIHEGAKQATEAVLLRMTRGGNSIIYWQSQQKETKKYFYPQNIESKILNYIAIGRLDMIVLELRNIQIKILENKTTSYDNIRFIYNQLLGVTIKYLSEMNINTSLIFANRGNVYDALAGCDTLDEIQEYLLAFYGDILEYMERSSHEDERYLGRILRYLEQHYSEDIYFEDMAKEIGISYSYMRKLVRESTGKSMLDYINCLRIQAAKVLLLEKEMSISEIAIATGYRNVQSLNRFFKKYEGLTPGEFKSANSQPSARKRE